MVKETTCGGSGILALLKVPKVSKMSYCVIKKEYCFLGRREVELDFCGLLRMPENVSAEIDYKIISRLLSI